MSTRAIIATAQHDQWAGIECAHNGAPTRLGPQIWRLLGARAPVDVAAFVQAVITDHPGGWDVLGERCYCHDLAPGGEDLRYEAAEDATNAALHISWVYVVGRHVLTVSTSVRRPSASCADAPHYGWDLVAQCPLNGPEPDWQAVEDRGEQLKEAAYARERQQEPPS